MSIYIGTEGSDSVSALPDQTSINTLGGNDFIAVWTPNGSSLSVNAGDGDDQVTLQLGPDSSPIDLSITLGAGRDTLKINDLVQRITVTDFATGDSGDVVNFRWVLDQWVNGYDNHSNPFAAGGFFRLVQVGADTVLQIDRHMSAPGTWTDFVLFQNTQVNAFTAANFLGAAPSGAPAANSVIQGTAGDDALYDGMGDDSVYGGAGNDNLYSGPGNDLLDGGDGDDWLNEDSTGSDKLYGGAGDDVLQMYHGSWNPGPRSVAYLDGGTGNDRLSYTTHRGYGGTLTALGGEGDDAIGFSGATTANVDLGSGADTVTFAPGGAFNLTLGSGRDTVMLSAWQDYGLATQQIHITDFEAGAAGDRLDLRSYVQFVGWDGVSSLIDNHYVEIQQVGDSTVVNFDRNGTARWQASFVLDHVKLTDLTAFNLTGLQPPGGAAFNGVVVNTFNVSTLNGGAGDDLVLNVVGSALVLNGGAGNDRLEGAIWADTLNGDDGNDILIASGGTDLLYGGNGDDLLDGGSGQDDLYGGVGNDVLEGGGDADALRGDSGFDFASYDMALTGVTANLTTRIGSGGDAQNDTYFSIEGVIGSHFADTLVGDGGGNTLRGGGGDDVLMGAGGGDTLDGGDGNDHLYGSVDHDVLIGGAGLDIVRYDVSATGVVADFVAGLGSGGMAEGDTYASLEGVVGSAFGDVMIGNSADNRFIGQGGDDVLRGGDGADILEAGAGNDHLYGGVGGDVLDGGAGYDFARYDDASSGVNVTLRLSVFPSQGGGAAGDELYGIEGLVGSSFADTLTGYDGSNIFYGQNGDDVLRGDWGADLLDGGAGNDLLDGGGDDDTLDGGAGDDALDGGAGADLLTGGAGNDHLYGGEGADVLVGGDGYDLARYDVYGGYGNLSGAVYVDLTLGRGLVGSAAGDTLTSIEGLVGPDGNDVLIGDAQGNTIYGQGGDDVVKGEAGDDALFGGDGADHLYGGAGADLIDGGAGFDFARFDGPGAARVIVDLKNGLTAEGDRLVSIEGLVASEAGDILYGDDGDNVIYGQGGDDRIIGGGGADRLYGGSGADVFAFDARSGVDLIVDFEATGAGHDIVALQANANGSAIVNFATLIARATNVGADVSIDLGAGNAVTIVGLQVADLSASLFMFY
jgi:Ca2+-binding RTX toxin-like protein